MLRVSNAEEIPEGVDPAKHLYQVNHNVFIAHCKAVKALRELQPDAQFCGMNAVTNKTFLCILESNLLSSNH